MSAWAPLSECTAEPWYKQFTEEALILDAVEAAAAAAAREDIQALQALFEDLADPPIILNQRDAGGKSPLLYGVANGSVEVVRVMLQNGADASLTDVDGQTALHVAVAGGNWLTVPLP